MIQKLKIHITAVFVTVAMSLLGLAVPLAGATASAASGGITNTLCKSSSTASGESQGNCNSSTNSNQVASGLQKIAKSVVTIFSVIVGAASVVMLIYGGFRYITSGGATEKVGDAKKTIIYAIIGLVIVALAQVIVNLTISATSGQAQSSGL